LGNDENISGLLREGTNEVDALVARTYGETNERLGFLARHQVVAHLRWKRMGVRLPWTRRRLLGDFSAAGRVPQGRISGLGLVVVLVVGIHKILETPNF